MPALPAAEVAVGAGQVSLSPMPGRAGRLHEDLADLRDWGADLLVTLTEAEELPAGFRDAVQGAGLDWLHLPIHDFGVPQEAVAGTADQTAELTEGWAAGHPEDAVAGPAADAFQTTAKRLTGEAMTSVTAAEALPELAARLARGERIALHCLGGCGRSGMIALRLMVLSGEAAGRALERLRAARPCAVETEAQRVWASREPPLP